MQTPKIIEALLVLTIPICERGNLAWVKLHRLGYPIVLVTEWDEVRLSEVRSACFLTRPLPPRFLTVNDRCNIRTSPGDASRGNLHY